LAVRGNGLPDNYADMAGELASLARQTCIKITGYSNQSKDDWHKVGKMDGLDWLVRRFYTSNTSWVKAEAASQGVIDDIYYEPNSRTIVCGGHSWSKYEAGNQIRFTEFGLQAKADLLPLTFSVSAAQTPLSTPSSTPVNSGASASIEKRTLAVRWEGYGNLMVGEVVIQQNKSLATLRVQLPAGSGACIGVSQLTTSSSGIWTMSCPSSVSASGTFVSAGDGKGASGVGKDSVGRAVEYTMGAAN